MVHRKNFVRGAEKGTTTILPPNEQPFNNINFNFQTYIIRFYVVAGWMRFIYLFYLEMLQ